MTLVVVVVAAAAAVVGAGECAREASLESREQGNSPLRLRGKRTQTSFAKACLSRARLISPLLELNNTYWMPVRRFRFN